ncbi:hypothetical protein Tco_1151927, partial [Tanacetum coccineum]
MGNTSPRVDKPEWDNTKRVNHQKNSKYPHLRKTFVPSGVPKRTGLITPVKQNEKRAVHKVSTARAVSTARPISIARPVSTTRPISIVRPFAPKIAQTSGAIRPNYLRIDNVRPRGSYSPIKRPDYTKLAFRPKDLKQDVKTFGVQNMTTARTRAVVNTGKGKMDTDLKKSRRVWRPKGNYLDHVSKYSGSFMLKKVKHVDPKGISKDLVTGSCNMTGNKAYLSDYEDFNGGFVAFRSDPKGDELKFNLFSVSQMCDKKNSILFTEIECLILSPSFKLLDESQVVLRAPRKDDVYSLDLKNIVPSGVSTDKPKVSTDKDDEGTAELKDGNSDESATPTVFGDDETIAQVLITMSQNKNKKRLAEEEATKAAFTNEYDFIQARLNADKILAEKLQEEEREKIT